MKSRLSRRRLKNNNNTIKKASPNIKFTQFKHITKNQFNITFIKPSMMISMTLTKKILMSC
jgi:hypothetical protein